MDDHECYLYYCLFRGSLDTIAVYVDDLIICGLVKAIDDVKKHLCNCKMKDLICIHRILGCEVLYDEYAGTNPINQTKYDREICNRFLPNGGLVVRTPLSNVTSCKEMNPKTNAESAMMNAVP